MNETPPLPLLVVLSGPSGVGKDAVLAGIKAQGMALGPVVTVTTRPHRPTEQDGVDYHFISTDEFWGMVDREELLEWAMVYGHWYGVPRASVKAILDRGQDALLKIDVQGAMTVKRAVPGAVLIFLLPPSIEELASRLRSRHTESPQQLALRLDKAREEMGKIPLFDYAVVNDRVERAIERILSIVTAEKCRTHPRQVSL